MEKGWRPHLNEIDRLHRRHGLPVLFTEIGYRSISGTTIDPSNFTVLRPLDLTEQTEAYEALFRVFWDRSWFTGLYLWNWLPNHGRAGGVGDDDYTPQNKPAEQVVQTWFGGGGG